MNLGFVGMGALCGGLPSGLSRRAIIRIMVFFHAKKSYLDEILTPFRKVDVREADVMEFLQAPLKWPAQQHLPGQGQMAFVVDRRALEG